MATEARMWVGRMLIGNDGSRLGEIADVVEGDDGEEWMAVRAVRDPSDVRLVPVRGTTERGVKDVVTWLDQADLRNAPSAENQSAPDRGPARRARARAAPPPPPAAAAAADETAPAAPPPDAPRAPKRRRAETNLVEIEGLGPADAASLVSAGVPNIDALLSQGGSVAGRRFLARQTGIDAAVILEWVNRADLMRIHGVGAEYSDLLESSGVDTVRELATRKPANLQAKMEALNEQLQLVRRAPSLSEVERWVEEAKHLPVAITY